jgi:hypothetical protein
MLGEKLQKMGMLGCLLCIVGSTEIVLHAPQEKSINSVQEIWLLAVQPGMLLLKDLAGGFFVFFFFLKLVFYRIMISYWFLFLLPAFLLYTASAIAIAFFLILYCAPRYGQTNIFIYSGICSIIGSLTVSEISSPIHLHILTVGKIQQWR